MKTQILGVLLSFSVVYFVGCTPQNHYSVSVRRAIDQASISGAKVTLVSLPRMRSFADPRHYLGACGHRKISEGVTDISGQVILALPADLGVDCIIVNDSWMLRRLTAEWTLMRKPLVDEKDVSAVTFDNIEVRLSE